MYNFPILMRFCEANLFFSPFFLRQQIQSDTLDLRRTIHARSHDTFSLGAGSMDFVSILAWNGFESFAITPSQFTATLSTSSVLYTYFDSASECGLMRWGAMLLTRLELTVRFFSWNSTHGYYYNKIPCDKKYYAKMIFALNVRARYRSFSLSISNPLNRLLSLLHALFFPPLH